MCRSIFQLSLRESAASIASVATLVQDKADFEMEYEAVVQRWRQMNVTGKEDLQQVLSQYAADFAYHSGKIENASVCWQDVQQIFQTVQAQCSDADARTLLEIQNAKKAHAWMLDAWEQKRPHQQDFVKELHKTLMQEVYDEAKTARGERPGA